MQGVSNLVGQMFLHAGAEAEVWTFSPDDDRVQRMQRSLAHSFVEFANHRAVQYVGFGGCQRDARHSLLVSELQADFLERHFAAPSATCAAQGAISSMSSSLQCAPCASRCRNRTKSTSRLFLSP